MAKQPAIRQNTSLKVAFESLEQSLAFGAPELRSTHIMTCFHAVIAEYGALYERTKTESEARGRQEERADVIAYADKLCAPPGALESYTGRGALMAFGRELAKGEHVGASKEQSDA